MKYKVLINGNNQTLLKDFFKNIPDDFVCLSTSDFLDDVKGHIRFWEPDVYVCLIEKKDSNQIAVLKNLAECKHIPQIPVVIITNEELYHYFLSGLFENVKLVLSKPISIHNIFGKISEFLEEKEKERRLERERLLKQNETEETLIEANRRKNILVVDDDKNVLKLLKAVLEEKYNVSTMITGKMAEKYLETRTCDLILLDYEMPLENGAEVFRKIREIESAKDIPIVFLTGVTEKEKIVDLLQLKPQGYLLKPIDADRVLEVIERLTDEL